MLASILWPERNRAGATGRAANPELAQGTTPGAAVERSGQKKRGTTMRIERRNTTEGQSPYAGIDFRLTTSEIRNPDGSVVFRLENVEVPEFWSQVASDVLAQKYFRKAGVAARLKKVEEETVPSWLWRSVPDAAALADLPESERYVSELSAKQAVDRLARCRH